ncbi:MAG: hypothetical protein NC394_10385 [Bacteroides sp.]|nr:hypothetical protein [Bacteroides sp.]
MKNNEKIYRELSEVNEEYIPVIEKKEKKLPLKFAALAAAAAAAAGAFAVRNADLGEDRLYIENTWQDFTIYSDDIFEGEGYDELPKIPYKAAETNGVSALYIETAYDISELDRGNPWSEELNLTSMPVFKNLSYQGNINIMPRYFSEAELTEMAEKAARALGVEAGECEIDRSLRSVNPGSCRMVCGGGKYGVESVIITVWGYGDITVDFGEPSSDEDRVKLPKGYSFTYYGTSERRARETVSYLTESFKELLQFELPVINVYRDYGFSGEGSMNYRVYCGSNDPVRSILNYFYDWATFVPYMTVSEDGGEPVFNNELSFIRRSSALSAADAVGNYPIITAEEAREMLIGSNAAPDTDGGGWYLSDGRIDAEDIKRVELVYNTDRGEYYMPYYQLAVEVSCDGDFITDKNLKSYCIYRVPAVRSEYLFDDFNPDLDASSAGAFFADEISFPDRSVLRKSQAVSTPLNDEFPILEYDFGFLRYMDSYSDNYPITDSNGWFKVRAGDTLENGMTVKAASYFVAFYDWDTHFYSSTAELSGETEASGTLYCLAEDRGDFSAGELYFYPDTENNVTLPHMAGLLPNGPDTLRISLGNIDTLEDEYLSDRLKELFEDGETARVSLTLADLRFWSFLSADRERVEEADGKLKDFYVLNN